MQTITSRLGVLSPWLFALLFATASALMIWRLEALSLKGFEGTVLGTLVMPYCSGIGNLVFAFVMGRQAGASSEVLINCLVNNATNLTLLIGIPTVIWGPTLFGKKRKASKSIRKAQMLNRLSLMLTLTAGLFFSGILWALGRDGRLDQGDGLVLVGVFVFWQIFHVYEVMKSNVRQNQSIHWSVYPELLVLLAGAAAVFFSIDGLVQWLAGLESSVIEAEHLGWISGCIMVLPNALLALFYGFRGKSEVMYSSQVGDGHICIPLCIGIYSLMTSAAIPSMFNFSMGLLAVALLIHLVLTAMFRELPRIAGWFLVAGYGLFLLKGLPQ